MAPDEVCGAWTPQDPATDAATTTEAVTGNLSHDRRLGVTHWDELAKIEAAGFKNCPYFSSLVVAASPCLISAPIRPRPADSGTPLNWQRNSADRSRMPGGQRPAKLQEHTPFSRREEGNVQGVLIDGKR